MFIFSIAGGVSNRSGSASRLGNDGHTRSTAEKTQEFNAQHPAGVGGCRDADQQGDLGSFSKNHFSFSLVIFLFSSA